MANQMWSTSIATVEEVTCPTKKEKGMYCLRTAPVKENVIACHGNSKQYLNRIGCSIALKTV